MVTLVNFFRLDSLNLSLSYTLRVRVLSFELSIVCNGYSSHYLHVRSTLGAIQAIVYMSVVDWKLFKPLPVCL